MTCRRYARADRPGRRRRPGLAERAGGRGPAFARPRCHLLPAGLEPSEGEPPRDHRARRTGLSHPQDGPGAALLRTLTELTADLPDADPGRIAAAALRGRSARADEAELRDLATEAAAGLISEDPAYSRLAARLLTRSIAAEAASQGVTSFTGSVEVGHREGLIADRTAEFVRVHAARLDALIDVAGDDRFGYFGLRTLHSRYLLRHPITRHVIETPQHFMLRVAAGLAEDDSTRALDEVAALYGLMSRLDYLPSSPTLFNSGTRHPQMSSCYLLDSPLDELDSIYDRYHQVARLSKHAGGIGLSYSRIRSRGSLIRGTNGHSNGIVPFLKTLDASVAAVNQGGRRKGAAAVYLETWHSDIEEFLELRDNTGEDARRTHNLNLAHWIPDEFMRRVNADQPWSLFSPADVPELVDLWGDEFDAAYRKAEADGKAQRTIPARDLYGRMMRTLAQTGNGWLTFKDAANRTANQTAEPGHTVHSSNLCTEILEVTDDGETAVCNLGSVNLGSFVDTATRDIDWERLDETVRTAVTFLDRVVDINFYPTDQAGRSNSRWRPVGLGAMGLQDVFFKLRLPFDSAEARALSTRISERIMLAAYEASADLAERNGPLPAWEKTRTARGVLHPDHYGVELTWPERWAALRERIASVGMRNSLLLAIAPTATIASIAGCLRVHRAAGLQPLQAGDPVGRVPPDQLVPHRRTQGARRLGRPDPRGAARVQRLGAGLHLGPRGDPRPLPHGVGDPAARPHRHGGGADPVPRPGPVPEPLHGDADHRQALLDVRVRLEVGPEDDVLPALAPGDAHRAGGGQQHRPRTDRDARPRGRRLLP